jgi:CIC family chloride channel protein
MSSSQHALDRFLGPVQRRLARIDLREHEDKILLLLTLVIGALVGLIVVAFVAATERMSKILLSAGGSQRFLSPVIGSLIGGWLLYRFFPDARGSGIPQTRVAIILNKGVIHLRTVVGKFICSSISLASGVALGREGPSVHIGAGIASAFARRLGLSEQHVRSMIPVGTAAAVAAAFNTPLAAVLFTLEEILADLHARVVGSVVIGAATSWIVLRLLLGDEPLFHVPAYQLVHPIEFLIYALLGLLGGLVSTVFVKLLLWQRATFLKTPARFKAYTPAVGGLVVGLLALTVPGVLGVGYNLVSDALNGQVAFKMMLILLVLKIIATTTCYGSGNAGGIFGPSLFIGAMLGGAVGQTAHTLMPDHTGNAGAYALVGMGAAFAGIVRTPMTSVIMIFEVTRDYTIIVPLMIANLCSYVLAQRLHKVPVYEALSLQEGIIMPSAAHLPEPLTVERAMRPLTSYDGYLADQPFAHPDDPLDAALQRMGAARVDQMVVIGRAGGTRAGVLHVKDVLGAYKESKPPQGPIQSWLPAVAAITIAAIAIVSGLVFWQRSSQAGRGKEAFESGEKLLARGQVDDAILAFRNALAHTPSDLKVRAALGLALVQSNHFNEASAYLNDVAKAQPRNGPVWMGMAEVALDGGDRVKGMDLLRHSLTSEWPVSEEQRHRDAQLQYATLLSGAGRKAEAIPLLLGVIERSGDDPATARKAADQVKAIGSPGQAEEAYAALASHFPADAAAWLRLGDARLAEDKVPAALEAYRSASKADAGNVEAQRAVMRVEDILRLDPTRRGLPVRERARRWDEILDRVVDAVAVCGTSPEIERAKGLAKKHAASIEAADQKMESAVSLWKQAPSACKTDSVLAHILSKLME